MNTNNNAMYKITKVRKVLRLKENGYQPATYYAWKVSGPCGLLKYFTTRKAATAWVKDYTESKPLTTENIVNILAGL
ncbi:hypothetical protein UFOVP449_17 [uncultured Caudovirales phage]|uniref:Uncharacterized protein n=1 Tax=uncultured Caudovirales phage TaxID=2100421 RepID=A0A6J5MAW3_9CAUD|nr:hypothetical protein UFOVP449_17 [uncultured Caudovirales phage]